MKAFKWIFKGILLYTTILVCFLVLAGLESIIENHYLIRAIGLIAFLIYACYRTMTYKEFYILTGNNFFKN